MCNCPTDKNTNRVPKKAWAKWNVVSRRMFNSVYKTMMDTPGLYKHPNAPKDKPLHWKVLAWNTAWTVADAVENECRI